MPAIRRPLLRETVGAPATKSARGERVGMTVSPARGRAAAAEGGPCQAEKPSGESEGEIGPGQEWLAWAMHPPSNHDSQQLCVLKQAGARPYIGAAESGACGAADAPEKEGSGGRGVPVNRGGAGCGKKKNKFSNPIDIPARNAYNNTCPLRERAAAKENQGNSGIV